LVTALRASSLLLAVATVSACTPTCDAACNKLERCELMATYDNLEACITSCSRQDEVYVAMDGNELKKSFRMHRRCIGSNSCDELAEGECYEEDIYEW